MSDAEIQFVATHSNLITLEKGHGAEKFGSSEKGIADTARRIKQVNPSAKVLFYFNSFINWPMYDALSGFRDEWLLRGQDGVIVKHPDSGNPRPDLTNAAFREWSDVVYTMYRTAPIDGVFVDALPQIFSGAVTRAVSKPKAAALVQGAREMIALTKSKLGANSIVVTNGLRGDKFREILEWTGIDYVLIEHFASHDTANALAIKADLDSVALACSKGKGTIIKGWPGFSFRDAEMMKRPAAELMDQAKRNITFPLACFLIASEADSLFCYSWGYTDTTAAYAPFDEFDRPLGEPKGPAHWNGMKATREFAHASVSIDLSTEYGAINWR